MIIEPKIRQFICTTAHPDGCREHVRQQIEYVQEQGPISSRIRNVLVIGSSTGYGLATRIAAAYGLSANTVGVMFERPATERRTATPGYYNNEAFESFAQADGRKAVTVNGDAFSREVKEETLRRFQETMPGEKFDLVVYSLAAPRRTMADGTVYNSVIKPVGQTYVNKTLNLSDNSIETATIEPATAEEVYNTVMVMGGSDWEDWMHFLDEAGALNKGAVTLAYSYIGPAVTQAIYYSGSIGKAKQDLYEAAKRMRMDFDGNYSAYVSINKAVVTQASSAIPSVGLYMTILFKVMKRFGTHEDCIEQMYRMLADRIATDSGNVITDDEELVRMDDWEMATMVQDPVEQAWLAVTNENMAQYCDIEGYWHDFYQLFGFGLEGVDYAKDVDLTTNIGRG
ncbi:MAG: trans-2-enoyl-CoA reductase family protein [Clostridia bacterium]|nr:trans-2-enoyl-CoA reductase family protein [Clostridia bacterium]